MLDIRQLYAPEDLVAKCDADNEDLYHDCDVYSLDCDDEDLRPADVVDPLSASSGAAPVLPVLPVPGSSSEADESGVLEGL